MKLATLQYLKSLVTLVESADVPTNKDSEMALAKIITWTSEPKSGDIRRAAHQALLSMFNTHTPEMTLVLGRLPQVHTPYTLHPTPYTLHPTPYTLHSTLYTLHSTLYTLHSTLYNVHCTLYTVHCTLDCTQNTLHYELYTVQYALYTVEGIM